MLRDGGADLVAPCADRQGGIEADAATHELDQSYRVHRNDGQAVRRWLVGQAFLSLCVGLLTGAGLALLGAPFPAALALLAGFMAFIPYIGPFVAAVPAILVGFAESPQLALWVALLFLAIQSIESYLLAPLVQHRAIYLPPAIILFTQVLMGVIVGALGVAVATPLAAAVMVAISMLYVEDALADKNAAPG
ncbi:MAG: hypothetical protein A3G81_06185 [Betaproteobacteria bacterium RIFCSPLOWO2_12_FULL_65_14]|nr:MAG: hypothetical protein A3G81_06185 [Betaproteobacteria bacterium RIFCSPLOWO2_12_FULL_65_14]